MPPTLALLLCTGFVLFLWRIERKHSPAIAAAVWIPTVWVMYCAGKPLAMWFGGGVGVGGIEGGSALDRNFLIGLIVLGLGVLARRRLDWQVIKRDNPWLLIICCYALVSIVWSEFPFVSVKRYIRFIGAFVMALVLFSEPTPALAVESILRRTVFAFIPFSLLLIKYYPSLGIAFGRVSGGTYWVGVATQKNSLGVLCLVAAFFLFWSVLRAWYQGVASKTKARNYADVLVGVLALLLLRGPSNAAASKTSFAVLALGCFCLLGMLWMKSRGRFLTQGKFIAVIMLAYGYGLGIPFGLNELFTGVVQALGRDATFTGRTEIWAELIPIAMDAPILGCGYGGFWVRSVESGVNEAHNGYLDVMLELGIVGLLLLSGFVVSMCRAAYAALPQDFWWPAFGLCFALMVVLHNASESTFLKTSDFLWTLMVFVSILLPTVARTKLCAQTGVRTRVESA